MKCPQCNETLLMTERMGVSIDYCPACRGIWLDKGELDKLLDLAAKDAAPAATPQPEREYERKKEQPYYQQPQYQPPHYQQPYHKYKKKSFLGDFFDFD
jgi:hypothetical protein